MRTPTMKNLVSRFALATLPLALLSACSTMHFTNGPEGKGDQASEPFQHWHHIGILELVEFSDPVDLSAECPKNGWSSATVQMGPPHAVIQYLVRPFYSPWDVKFACKAK
jgi:hypothetical protein